jgi:hypothetical protein
MIFLEELGRYLGFCKVTEETFKDEEDFIKTARELGFKEKAIAHEKAHFDTAKNLGHNPTYVRIRYEFNFFFFSSRYSGLAVTLHPAIPCKDLIAIVSAPQELSEGDLKMLKRLKHEVPA